MRSWRMLTACCHTVGEQKLLTGHFGKRIPVQDARCVGLVQAFKTRGKELNFDRKMRNTESAANMGGFLALKLSK